MRKKKNRKKQRKWKAGIKAGCLALGLATAWGGEACGDVIMRISATPTQTLSKAFVYYGVGYSSSEIQSLGTLPAGETTTLYYDIGYPPRDSYMLVGLYDEGGNPGAAISFPNNDPITVPTLWAEIFESSYYKYTEAQVIDCVNLAETGYSDELEIFMGLFGSSYPDPCATEFGKQSTLVFFSNPTFGGVVTVDIVPEPATWVLLIGVAGTVLLLRRDLFRG